jgi:anaerobic magnesium-protoporphyrin IX monomethyl ester cyclase
MAGLSSSAEVAERVLRHDPDLMALSVYVWNVREVKRLIKEVRCRQPDIRIVVGGPEVCYAPEMAVQEMQADWVCTGEGEGPFLALLEALDAHPGFSRSLPGMLHRDGRDGGGLASGMLVETLDDIPSPYLSGHLEIPHGGWADVETMRGCPFKCHFCLYGKQFRLLCHISFHFGKYAAEH